MRLPDTVEDYSIPVKVTRWTELGRRSMTLAGSLAVAHQQGYTEFRQQIAERAPSSGKKCQICIAVESHGYASIVTPSGEVVSEWGTARNQYSAG